MHSAPLPPGHLRPKHLFLVLFGHFVNGAGQNVFLMLNRALCCRLGATAYFNEISRLFSTVTQGFTCPERRLFVHVPASGWSIPDQYRASMNALPCSQHLSP